MGNTNNYSNVLTFVIIIAFVAYGFYLIYLNIKRLLEFKKIKSEKFNYSNAYHYKDIKDWLIIYSALLVLLIVMFVKSLKGDDYYIIATYIFIILFTCSLMIEVFIRRTIVFGNENFLFDNKVIRYKDIKDIYLKGKFIKNYELKTYSNITLNIPHKLGLELISRRKIKGKKK
ncbi:MAG: hypothetical protein GX675_03945 [Erysipelotrichaceae bacterium]|nr:hypothetical protein [Erysipelotrichaceae bacterium]